MQRSAALVTGCMDIGATSQQHYYCVNVLEFRGNDESRLPGVIASFYIGTALCQ